MGISVVIRAFNEEQHIGRLLSGLERQAVRADQIVVVDSGSTDSTRDIARHYGADIVEIASESFSFGRALNIGCEAAKEEVLVFLSAHVYPVYETFLERLTAPFEDAQVALSYGRQVGDGRTKYSETRIMLQWFPAVSTHKQSHPFCNNANAAVRRSLWLEHPYKEELTGLEDLDWARRVQGVGKTISYVAEAPVVHVHEETWAQVANRYRREAIAYAAIVGAEGRVGTSESVYLAASNIVGDYLHAVRDGALLPNIVDIPRFRLAQFWGAWKGARQTEAVSDQLRKRFYYPAARATSPAPDLHGRPIDYSEYGSPDRSPS